MYSKLTFYSLIALATLGGVLPDFAPVDPIAALVLSAQVNGAIRPTSFVDCSLHTSLNSIIVTQPFVRVGRPSDSGNVCYDVNLPSAGHPKRTCPSLT